MSTKRSVVVSLSSMLLTSLAGLGLVFAVCEKANLPLSSEVLRQMEHVPEKKEIPVQYEAVRQTKIESVKESRAENTSSASSFFQPSSKPAPLFYRIQSHFRNIQLSLSERRWLDLAAREKNRLLDKIVFLVLYEKHREEKQMSKDFIDTMEVDVMQSSDQAVGHIKELEKEADIEGDSEAKNALVRLKRSIAGGFEG